MGVRGETACTLSVRSASALTAHAPAAIARMVHVLVVVALTRIARVVTANTTGVKEANATSLAAVVEIANSKARAGLVMIARSARAWAGVVPVGGQAEVRPIIPCPLVLLLQ